MESNGLHTRFPSSGSGVRGWMDLAEILHILDVCFHARSPGAGIIGSQGERESQGLCIRHLKLKCILKISCLGTQEVVYLC